MDFFLNNFDKIAVSIIVGATGSCFAYRTIIKNRRIGASDKFSNTILSELKEVYPVVTNWPDHPPTFFANKFTTLQLAASEFEAALPIHKKLLLRRAWRLYRVGKNPTNKKAEQDYFQYMGATINDHYIDPRKLLKNNVDRLLKYAKT